MNLSTILLAAAEAEKSKTPFFIAGALLASYAIIISVIGFKNPDFPGDAAKARGVMGLGVALVAVAMASIVYVSN
jgi:hypothetical protein